jgi:hypothetical protein
MAADGMATMRVEFLTDIAVHAYLHLTIEALCCSILFGRSGNIFIHWGEGEEKIDVVEAVQQRATRAELCTLNPSVSTPPGLPCGIS